MDMPKWNVAANLVSFNAAISAAEKAWPLYSLGLYRFTREFSDLKMSRKQAQQWQVALQLLSMMIQKQALHLASLIEKLTS